MIDIVVIKCLFEENSWKVLIKLMINCCSSNFLRDFVDNINCKCWKFSWYIIIGNWWWYSIFFVFLNQFWYWKINGWHVVFVCSRKLVESVLMWAKQVLEINFCFFCLMIMIMNCGGKLMLEENCYYLSWWKLLMLVSWGPVSFIQSRCY